MRSKPVLLVIIFLGFLLRVVLLDKYPPSLNWDEISHGYNAYSILKTGADEWGQVFPITNFRAYGDYPLPLNLYLTAPFVAILGLTEYAIRLPHAILGVLTIISAYFLALGITKKMPAQAGKNISLFTALLVSITPWYVFTSRVVFQSNLSVFLLITGMALFFNRHKNRYFLPISFVFLGLTLFAYHSTRIFTSLLLVPLILIYKRAVLTKLSVLILLVFFLPLPLILSNPEARARSNVVFIINQGAIDKIEQARNSSTFSPLISKALYNKPVYFVKEFSKNYIGYYSPQYLFFGGGTQYQFSVPNRGLLYSINLPFFYLGLLILFKKALKGEKDYRLILVWLLLAPVPASITTEKFAVLRSTTSLPLPEILTAIGLFATVKWLQAKKINLVLTGAAYFVVLAISVESYLTNYLTSYTNDYSWAWQYGYKQAVNYSLQNYENYDKIIFTKKYGEPHEYVVFYSAWDPRSYKNDPGLIRYGQSNWFWVDRFDKFYFVNDWQIPRAATQDFVLESGGNIKCQISNIKCLLVTSPGNVPENWAKLETINFLDGKPAFEIYENRVYEN